METLFAWAAALPALLILALVAWVVATARRNAGLVDIFWPLFFAAAAAVYAAQAASVSIVLVLVLAWALRLAGYLAWRNWSAEEDRRYRAIRARNEPNFAVKSLYLVFGLQAVLAWVISAPLSIAVSSEAHFFGLGLVVFGTAFEAVVGSPGTELEFAL